MLIQCKSCEKKFVVPDSAIGPNGRLVQCSSCGNKWTQLPLKIVPLTKDQTIEKNEASEKVLVKKKKKNKKNKNQIPKFSKEYLQKKYNLKIKDAIGVNVENNNLKKNKIGFGFYSYLTIIMVFLVTLFGAIHLSKDIIILYLPVSELYIDYLYEVLEIMKTIFNDLMSSLLEKLFF